MAAEKLDSSLRKKDYATLFFLIFAIILGGYARLGQVLKSNFPLNDGGMFYQMTVELQANNYLLPFTTSYNGLDIPFVYPPLPFYIIGLVSDVTRIELLDMYRVLPGVISVFTIPAFYFLARDFLKRESQVSLAVLIFALMPTTFEWLIMGGGITRALGFLASIMTLQQTYRMYTSNKRAHVLGVTSFATLAVLSHPEAAVHTIAGVLILFWFYGRQRRGVILSVKVAAFVLGLTSPWWVSVIQRHGFAPVLAAGQTGWHHLDGIYQLWSFNFTNEIGLSILGVSALIGVFISLANREFIFPVWLLFTFAVEPRSAPLYLTPILALLGAIVLELLFAKLNSIESSRGPDNKTPSNWAERLLSSRGTKIVFAYFLTQWIFSANAIPIYINWGSTLAESDLVAFDWVRDNMPPDSKFGVITGKKNLLADPTTEWFPALTNMVSLNTPQGHEWLPESDFNQILIASGEVQDCAQQDIECIKRWEDSYEIYFDYLYIRKIQTNIKGEPLSIKSPLEMSMVASGDYESLYQTEEVSILGKR